VPCVSNDAAIAVLALGRRESGEPLTSEDMALLTAVAGQAGKGAQVQGVQVHVDPATGQVRQPSAAEVKALADAVRVLFGRSAQGVQVTEHADGSLSARMGPESLNVWVATIGPDGSLRQACVEGANAAGALQAAPALEVK